MPDPASAPPMVPSARERLQPYYPRVRPSEAEELQERAYRDGWNAALAHMLPKPSPRPGFVVDPRDYADEPDAALAASQAETTKFRDIAFDREEMIGQLVTERDSLKDELATSQAEVARLRTKVTAMESFLASAEDVIALAERQGAEREAARLRSPAATPADMSAAATWGEPTCYVCGRPVSRYSECKACAATTSP